MHKNAKKQNEDKKAKSEKASNDNYLPAHIMLLAGIVIIIAVTLSISKDHSAYYKAHNALFFTCFLVLFILSIGILETLKDMLYTFRKLHGKDVLVNKDKVLIVEALNVVIALTAIIFIIDWPLLAKNSIQISASVAVILILSLWPLIRGKLRSLIR